MATVHYLDANAIAHDLVYIATQLDEIDPRVHKHTRMSIYDCLDGKWYYHDVDMNVISICIKLNHANDPEDRRLISLSFEGELDIFAKGDYVWRTEKIPEAGLRLGTRGRMTHIRQISAHLFACGHNGQVYQRMGTNSWRAIDNGIYQGSANDRPKSPEELLDEIMNRRILNCIDGNNESDIYVVGDSGYMAHFNGTSWNQVALKTDEHLQWIRCYGPDEVWACGYNGTLLKGNVKDGFKDVSSIDDNDTWWCLTKYGEDIYLSATKGLFKFDSKSKKIAPVKTGLKPEHQDTYRLDSKDGALWSVGEKDIARLFNGRWERIHDIDNPKIGK